MSDMKSDSTGLILDRLGPCFTNTAMQGVLSHDEPPEMPTAEPNMANVIANCLSGAEKKDKTHGK